MNSESNTSSKSRKTCFEVFVILTASLMIGLIANFLSPKGIALIRDDSDRFAVDTAQVKSNENTKSTRQYTKDGFVRPQNIPSETAKKLFDEGAIFIDGREPHEFKEGHIKGAINVDYKLFKDKTKEEKLEIMKNVGKEQTIVSYCGGGECEISIDNAYEFAKIGYNEVKIYLGGTKEWTELGLPMEK